MFTVSCLAPLVLLAGYCEVSIKYGLGAGSVLFNKNRAVNLPAAAMILFTVVSLSIQLQHRDGSELGHCAWPGTENKASESTATPSAPLGALVSSKLQGTLCEEPW